MELKPLSRFIKKSLCVGLAVLLTLPLGPVGGNAKELSSGSQEVQLLKGDILTVPANNLTRVSVTDPAVADITDAGPDQVVIVGKETGQTVLFTWDDDGKKTIVIRVVSEDLSVLSERIASLLESAELDGVTLRENDYEGKVVLSGNLPEDKMETLQQVLEPFSDRVISFVKKEDIKDLIQIDMQVTELSTTLTKELGVDWSTGAAGEALAPGFQETLPTATGKFKDLFKIGDFNRSNAILATVNALIMEGKAKILSKPRLVVVNGKEARFLVGGEIPIKSVTTSSSGASSTENTDFKEYGVSMAITPTIRNGKIDVLLDVEISDIDSTHPSGDDIAFITRSAQTQLLLDNRQTIVLAGLIKKRTNEEVKKVPFLGSIPVLGALFRTKGTPVANEDTEVVISLTPTVLEAPKKFESVQIENTPVYPQTGYVDQDVMPAEYASEYDSMDNGRNAEDLPVIARNAVSVPVTVTAALEPYARGIQQRISSAIAYPYEAQQKGWQGTVKLSLVIQRDGVLKDAFVKESSGYDIFDQDAVNTARILAPYEPFPAEMAEDEITISLPIVYSMDAFLKSVAMRN